MIEENEILLPKKKENKINFNKPKDIEENLYNLLLNNIKFIEEKSWYWDTTDEFFSFNLPPTIFTEKIKLSPNKNYINENIQYENNIIIGQKLSENQLNQIWENGKFTIPSNKKIPYEWQLSLWTVKGINNIFISWISNMSISYYFIYHIKSRFTFSNYKNFVVSFPSSFYSLYVSLKKLGNHIFGLPSFINNEYQLKEIIKKEQLMNFINNHPEINIKLFVHKFNRILYSIDNNFMNIWSKKEIELKTEYYAQDMTKNEVLTQIEKDKKESYIKYLNENNDLQNLIETYNDLMDYLYSDQIIQEKKYEMDKEYKKRINEYDKELKETNYIKYNVYGWRKEKENKYEEELKKELNQNMKNKIQNEINQYHNPSLIYENYNLNEMTFEQRLNELKSQREKIPKYTNSVYRICLRPYEIITNNRDNIVYYELKKYEEYKSTSKYPFWRFYLFFIKYFVYIWNISHFLLKTGFNSSIGLKALFYYTFFTDTEINSTTGEIYDYNEAYTYRKTLNNIWLSICNSRNEFEESPDTGLFGKSFYRILNLIYNYFIMLILVGGCVFIFYPIVIIVCFILSIVLFLCSPILGLIGIIMEYLFNLLIYDSKTKNSFFPLIVIIFYNLLFRFIFQFILCIIFLIFQPILSLIILIFAQIRYCFRRGYDYIMYYIIKWIAKVPETDTCIAWKISGPSLFINRYSDINNSDIICLCIGKIEEMVLNDFYDNVNDKLDEPNKNIQKNINSFYSLINMTYNTDHRIYSSINFYKRKLTEQINERKKLYPVIDNEYGNPVKFTSKRLFLVKGLITKYLIEFSKVNDIDFIYKKHIEFGGKIEKITDYLLEKIFGDQIMETLEEYDEIVYLAPQSKTVLDNIAKKIFEDPYYQDKKIVEDRSNKKKEEIVDFPQFSTFTNIFHNNSPITLNLNLLTIQERRNLLGIEYLE